MWLYIKQLLQLLLSPARGWEDVSAAALPPDEIQRRGFYPWIGIVAASQFLNLIHDHHDSFFTLLQGAVAISGALFISLYLARLFLDITLPQHIGGDVNFAKINIFANYLIGLIGLYHIIANAMPASMTFLHFLPALSLLVIFKSVTFIGIKEDNIVVFLVLAGIATIAVPIAVAALLTFII